jgi:hypothetical protein
VTWWAFVDESMRQRRDGSGIYVLAAAILDPADAPLLREALATLPRHRRTFHWYHEEDADRRKAVAVVGQLDALHLVTVGMGLDNPRQERGRAQCMERLLWELERAGVSRVWLDKRTDSLNRRDLALVDRLRVRSVIGPAVRVDFAHPFDGRDGELLLWLPDITAGAVSAARGDGDEQYLGPLEGRLEEFPLQLR